MGSLGQSAKVLSSPPMLLTILTEMVAVVDFLEIQSASASVM